MPLYIYGTSTIYDVQCPTLTVPPDIDTTGNKPRPQQAALTLYGTLATSTSKNGRGTLRTSPWIICSNFSHSLRRRHRKIPDYEQQRQLTFLFSGSGREDEERTAQM